MRAGARLRPGRVAGSWGARGAQRCPRPAPGAKHAHPKTDPRKNITISGGAAL